MFERLNVKHRLFSFILLFLITILQTTQAKDTFKTGYFNGADGNKMFYRHGGKGENIIYVHGGPGFDSTDGGYEFDDLAKNFHLIAYDQRGGGNSEIIEDPNKITLERHIEDLEALRKHFKFEKLNLMGMSWGTALSLMYARKYPHRVERLIITAPMPLSNNMLQYRYKLTNGSLSPEDQKAMRAGRAEDLTHATDEQIVANCRKLIPILFRRYESPYTDWSNLKGDLCSPNPQGIKMRWSNHGATMASIGNFDWREEARQVNIPTFITEGGLSLVPLSTTRVWGAIMPNSRLKFMKKAGHIIWVDDVPTVVKDIEVFMQGQWPEGAKQINPTHLDLLARYTFENSTKNAQDNWFHPKISGKTAYTSNRHNRKNAALELSSQKSAVTVKDAKWYANENTWSISGWFNIEKSSKGNKGLLTQGKSINFSIANNKLKFTIGDLTIFSANDFQYDKWQHIAVSRYQDTFTLYINGELVGAGNQKDIPDPQGDFVISNMVGKIDGIRIYARAQNAKQIDAVYRQLDSE